MSPQAIDPKVRVSVTIVPLSKETREKCTNDPRLDNLRKLIEGQAKIIGEGLEDNKVLEAIGKLFAQRYADINTTLLPGVCLPLFEAINDLFDTYGEEVAHRIILDRSAKMSASFVKALHAIAIEATEETAHPA